MPFENPVHALNIILDKVLIQAEREMTPTLNGRRILLRPLTIEDAPAIQSQFPHWHIVKNLSTKVPWPYPEDGAHQFLTHAVLPQMESGHFLGWAICEQASPEQLIGVITYNPDGDKGLRRGFWLAEAHQGQGYMTEAVTLMQDYIFGTLEFPELFVMNAVENTASRRIKEKLCGTYVGAVEFEHLSGGKESEMWVIRREDWLKFRQEQSQ